MRRMLLVTMVAALASLGWATLAAVPAGAVVRSAADLAADCNDDGLVSIAENTQFVGGSADIWGHELAPGVVMCRVDIVNDGVSLAFINVNLRAKGNVSFNVGQSSSRANTSVTVAYSTIDMHPPEYAGGFVSIKSGCCGGFPGEHDTRVTVLGSTLRGTSIELGASLAAPNGTLTLTGNTITATGDTLAGAPDIEIRTSVGAFGPGVNGRINALLNRFSAPGGLRAQSGDAGNTWIVANNFTGVSGGVTLTTGPGGSCTSFLNGPGIVCT
jgi:hypothetical protein